MKRHVVRWVFGLLASVFLLSSITVTAQAWEKTVSGEAYGVSVNVVGVNGVVVTVPRTPDVVLPSGGGTASNKVASITIPGTLASQTLTVTTTGSIGATAANAQSSSTVERGLVKKCVNEIRRRPSSRAGSLHALR